MTYDLFEEWLVMLLPPLKSKAGKVALLLHNCSACRVYPVLSSVEVVFLPLNTMAGLESLDIDVIANFKALYRWRVLERLALTINHLTLDTSGQRSPPAGLMTSLLKAVDFIYDISYEVEQDTIQNCL